MLCSKFKPLFDHIKMVNSNNTNDIIILRDHLHNFFELINSNLYQMVSTKQISDTDYEFYNRTMKSHLLYVTNIKNNKYIQFYMDRISELQNKLSSPMLEYLYKCMDILIDVNFVLDKNDTRVVSTFFSHN